MKYVSENGDILELGFKDDFLLQKSNSDDSCVYVLEMNDGSTKIGVTKQFLARIANIERDVGLNVIRACHSYYMNRRTAFDIETYLHRHFDLYLCYRREYFSITFEEGVNKLREVLSNGYSENCYSQTPPRQIYNYNEVTYSLNKFIEEYITVVCDERTLALYQYNHWRILPSKNLGYDLYREFCEYVKLNSDTGHLTEEISRHHEYIVKRFEKLKRGGENIKVICSCNFNYQPYLLNCSNGMVDLRTGTLLPHDKASLLGLCTGVEYRGLNYRFKDVDNFLAHILPDEKTRIALTRYLGYCLTGYTTEEFFLTY